MNRNESKHFKKQLFICTNTRKDGTGCAPLGSLDLVAKIKQSLRDDDLWSELRVTKAGCLGGCANGINAVLYPEQIHLEKIKQKDTIRLLDLLKDDSENN